MIDLNSIFWASVGGVCIGASASILYAAISRIAGISGICHSLILPRGQERMWKVVFILGMLVSSGILIQSQSHWIQWQTHYSMYRYALAGLLVGIGTHMANGCTSGHGVCGLSRFSLRSLLAVMCFMASAILCVVVLK